MPRRRWRLQPRREDLPESWRRFFATGDKYGDGVPDGTSTPVLCWIQFEPMWRRHGEMFVAEWVAEHAGSRPWAWWKYDATEARRVIRGTELLDERANSFDVWWRNARRHFGVPALRQCRPSGYIGLPTVESQASYLDRLGLLGAVERAALREDAFEPEAINPFMVTEDELRARGVIP